MRLPHALCLLSLACGPDPASCPAADACPTDACMVLQGYRLDPPSACVAERRSFCVAGTDVDELETVATDADGARWLFGSTTVPDGWTPADSAPDESGANAWPDCH